MATKTISITKGAYDRLKVLKKERESFTDVINRITKNDLTDFYGILGKERGDELENNRTHSK